MEAHKKSFQELEFMNGRMLIGYGMTVAVLFAAYLVELLKGNRTPGYVAIFSALLLAPLLLSFLIYRKDKGSLAVRTVAAIGYGILYAFVLWTSVSVLSFVYIIPMLVIFSLYQDKKLAMGTGILTLVINVVFIVMNIMKGVTKEDIVNYEIEIAAILMVVGYSYMVSRTLDRISSQKIRIIEEEKEKTANILNQMVGAVSHLSANIADITEESRQIAEQGKSSKTAVEDIVTGTNELAATIQNQLRMTENIKQLTFTTRQSAKDVQDKFIGTRKAAEEGNQDMEELGKTSSLCREAGHEVDDTMAGLMERTAEAKEILGLIEEVTDQTTLLALNASIEAARAGEAGKGFAVVADEIGKLAADSASAAEQIQDVSTIVIKAVNALADEASRMVKFVEDVAMKGYSDLVQTSEEYHEESGKINDMMQAFSDQAQQLQNNMDEIRQVMESVNHSVEESALGVSRISEMSSNINDNVKDIEELADTNMGIANMLDIEVNKFRLE